MYCTAFYNEMVSRGIHNCNGLGIGIMLILVVKSTSEKFSI